LCGSQLINTLAKFLNDNNRNCLLGHRNSQIAKFLLAALPSYLDDWLGWGAGCVRIRGNILQFSHTKLMKKHTGFCLFSTVLLADSNIFVPCSIFADLRLFPLGNNLYLVNYVFNQVGTVPYENSVKKTGPHLYRLRELHLKNRSDLKLYT
jgi:hypothetical protein